MGTGSIQSQVEKCFWAETSVFIEHYYCFLYLITDSFVLLLLMERKKPAEVVATHQPSTVNSQKGGLGESLLLLHGNPAAQGHKSDTKTGCAVTRPCLPEPDKEDLLQDVVECLFL